MAIRRGVDIDGEFYYEADIQNMNREQLHGMCGFLDLKGLEFVRRHCAEEHKVMIDNIIFKL